MSTINKGVDMSYEDRYINEEAKTILAGMVDYYEAEINSMVSIGERYGGTWERVPCQIKGDSIDSFSNMLVRMCGLMAMDSYQKGFLDACKALSGGGIENI